MLLKNTLFEFFMFYFSEIMSYLKKFDQFKKNEVIDKI